MKLLLKDRINLDMKRFLPVIILTIICSGVTGQSIKNASLSTSISPQFGVVPEGWSKEGVATELFAYNEDQLAIPFSKLFPSADTTDVFFGFFHNTIDQFGGMSQLINGLKQNTEYCISFEAAANRPWEPGTSIDFELYFDNVLHDSETFIYPSDSSQIVDLCFMSSSDSEQKKLMMRTNNLVGLTTYVLIKAGSGSFYESPSTSSIDDLIAKKIKISPNPTNGLIMMDIPYDVHHYGIGVFTISGVKVIEHLKYFDNYIDLTSLQSGVYYIEIIVGNKKEVLKIILAK